MASVYRLVALDLDAEIPSFQDPELEQLAGALRALVGQLRQEMVHSSHLDAMFSELPTLLLQLDVQGTIVSENRAAQSFFGVPTLGQSAAQVIMDCAAQTGPELSVLDLLGGLRLELLDGGGQIRHYALRAVPLSDRFGAIQGYLLQGVDHSSDARALAAERAAATATQEAAAMRSRVLAALSHELRTPLNGVLGFTSLLEQNGPTAEALVGLRRSGGRLERLVGDVLDFAALDVGAFELCVQPFKPADLVRALTPDRVQLSFGALPVWLQGDPARLRQLLLRLLVFVEELSDGDPITAHVDAAPERGAHGLRFALDAPKVVLSEQEQEHLFAPLESSGEMRGRVPGQGLGLAMAEALAQAMGGSLSLTSTPEDGTRLVVDLVLAACEQTRPALEGFEGLRVAIVDDNPINLMVAERLLQRVGAETLGFAGGQEALEALSVPDRVDLVLMDLEMPGMDGFQTTAAMRRVWQGLGPPVFALTALAGAQLGPRCQAAGLQGVLFKPFEIERLRTMLGEVRCRASGH